MYVNQTVYFTLHIHIPLTLRNLEHLQLCKVVHHPTMEFVIERVKKSEGNVDEKQF